MRRSLLSWARQNSIKLQSGTVKEFHENNKLLLDFDQIEIPYLLGIVRRLEELGLDYKDISFSESSSQNWHCVIHLSKKIPHFAILFAQLYMGSDRRREASNFLRFLHHSPINEYSQILWAKKLYTKKEDDE